MTRFYIFSNFPVPHWGTFCTHVDGNIDEEKVYSFWLIWCPLLFTYKQSTLCWSSMYAYMYVVVILLVLAMCMTVDYFHFNICLYEFILDKNVK